jgi:hypothetical protein
MAESLVSGILLSLAAQVPWALVVGLLGKGIIQLFNMVVKNHATIARLDTEHKLLKQRLTLVEDALSRLSVERGGK